MFAASAANMRWFVSRLGTATIGPDKLNQFRHVRVLRDAAGIAAHMEAHRRLLLPKFAALREVFDARLAGRGVACWTDPRGGYFVSLDVLDGCARRVVELAMAAGIQMVPATTRATATSGSHHPPRRRRRSARRRRPSPPASSSRPASGCSPTGESTRERASAAL